MQDLRDAIRALRATPLVTTVAILSLALGIGANTAMFSIVDSLMLRTLPVPHAERLALVTQGGERSSWTNPIWEQVRDRSQLFDGAMAWSGDRFNLARAGESDLIDGIWASGSFFDVLGVPAILGRTFVPADDRRGGGPDGPVAVISYAYWQRHYGGVADVIGRPLTLNQKVFTIVGVTPPEFYGPEVGRAFDVVVPLGAEPVVRGTESFLDRRSTWWLDVMVRLKPGQTLAAATTAFRTVQPQIREATLPENWRPQDLERYLKDDLSLQPAARGTSYLRSRYERPLITIMVVVSLVLLIACGNIANLLLARATSRRHELSVRQALGASRWRLARQLLAESVVLSAAGAMLGVFVAVWGSRLLVHQLSTQDDRVFLDLALNWRMLGFTAAAAVGTALLFGTAPALRAASVEPMEAMREQGRGNSSGSRMNLGGSLVIAQVALSLVLVIGAGLFVRTFSALAGLDLGFERDRVLVANVGAERSGADSTARAALYEGLRQAAATLPGATSAAASVITPVSGSAWNDLLEVPGGTVLPEKERMAYVNLLTPGWFATYGTRLLAGRDFSDRDRLGSPLVAIVNEEFAKHFLAGANPIGRTIRMTDRPRQATISMEIVGYVVDAVYGSLRDPVPPTMYFPLAQQANVPVGISISVRTRAGSPAALSRSLASALSDVNPNLTLSLRTLESQVDSSLLQERTVAMLSAFFGGLALLLAGLGLYGVTSYSVSRRRTEIGIRMALGSAPGGVMRLVLGRVALLVGIGVAIGALASWWGARFVETLLYGLTPQDPLTIAISVCVLAGVGVLAGWLPARRAARIDPATVLREE